MAFVGTPLERARQIAKLSRDRNEFDRRMRPILHDAQKVLGPDAARDLRREARAIFHEKEEK
jgi:hypothetical protein